MSINNHLLKSIASGLAGTLLGLVGPFKVVGDYLKGLAEKSRGRESVAKRVAITRSLRNFRKGFPRNWRGAVHDLRSSPAFNVCSGGSIACSVGDSPGYCPANTEERNVSRVYYDTTPKPPGTIEFE